jgi:hypothetical protein
MTSVAVPWRAPGNVLYYSYNAHTVRIDSSNNVVTGNLAMGTVKYVDGSSFDLELPSTFFVGCGGGHQPRTVL